ncbi:diacylglycerol/lipid kinase family protein [Reichenbachiella ulvae]|uniref:Diacylglycerol kinase family lipid kinase n=1 Tax=Reichenbachiella ulvae TaxID=2980104 RepID=A0ABT3CW43_9BACT|nr:diacylglycerol kinase family protein [Reichenbachiella ulvae]MCV9387690.1 diacylglycerol kinase family lipid kinase [Reichenbachiella ulvae]
MRKKILFIANPISGNAAQLDLEGLIQEVLDQDKFEWQLYYTTERGDATVRAHKATEENLDWVIAVGGDGTINEVAQGLIHSEVPMGILPRGSGNGLAYHIGWASDIRKSLDMLNHATIESMDTALFNGNLFLNVAGVGFDAHIAHVFDTHGKRGFFSYLFLTVREFLGFDSQRVELVLDGKVLNRSAFLLSIANGSQYGNNAYIAPDADSSDGFLEVVIVKSMKGWNALTFAFKLFTKRLKNGHGVEIKRANKIEINTTFTCGHLDGEPIGLLEENRVEILPRSLKILVPKK